MSGCFGGGGVNYIYVTDAKGCAEEEVVLRSEDRKTAAIHAKKKSLITSTRVHLDEQV